MKRHFFGFTGGFPLTQDRLLHMQNGWEEGFHAVVSPIREDLLALGVILSGMELTRTDDLVDITPGWMACKASGADTKLVRFVGATGLLVPESTNKVRISTDGNITSNLVYNDGVSRPAVLDNVGIATSVLLAAGGTPGIYMDYTSMLPYAVALNYSSTEEEFLELDCTSGDDTHGVFGMLYYKKNKLANTLHITGTVTISDPSGIVDPPDVEPLYLGDLAAGYAPANDAHLVCRVRPGGGGLFRLYGGGVLNTFIMSINGDGAVLLTVMRPLDIVAEYSVDVNAVVPLG